MAPAASGGRGAGFSGWTRTFGDVGAGGGGDTRVLVSCDTSTSTMEGSCVWLLEAFSRLAPVDRLKSGTYLVPSTKLLVLRTLKGGVG